jgi:hypothetical protein
MMKKKRNKHLSRNSDNEGNVPFTQNLAQASKNRKTNNPNLKLEKKSCIRRILYNHRSV